MEDIILPIKEAMAVAGVEGYWQGVALDHIQRGLNSNRYFTTGILTEPEVIASDHGYARKVSVVIARRFPDSDKSDKARLTYTFNPRLELSHHVAVDAISPAR